MNKEDRGWVKEWINLKPGRILDESSEPQLCAIQSGVFRLIYSTTWELVRNIHSWAFSLALLNYSVSRNMIRPQRWLFFSFFNS